MVCFNQRAYVLITSEKGAKLPAYLDHFYRALNVVRRAAI